MYFLIILICYLWYLSIILKYTVNPHVSGPTYPDYSFIRTHVWEPIMITCIYIDIDSLKQIFSYLDSQLGMGGVRISDGPLCVEFEFTRIKTTKT